MFLDSYLLNSGHNGFQVTIKTFGFLFQKKGTRVVKFMKLGGTDKKILSKQILVAYSFLLTMRGPRVHLKGNLVMSARQTHID